jgi:hypothetical protein
MRGLDPRIHPSSQGVLRRRWITGSSPVMALQLGRRPAIDLDLKPKLPYALAKRQNDRDIREEDR